jgi:anthranilate/para-aminobenzoate synthase component II
VQFHPESIKTKIGIKILKNFIKLKKWWRISLIK